MADLPMMMPRSSGMPSPAPMPAAAPMGPYANPQALGFTPAATTQIPVAHAPPYSQQPNRMVGGDFANVASNEAPSKPMGLGQNGFGIHPDVGHTDIVDYLLPKFRSAESSNNYQAQHPQYPKFTASGAFGYTDGTWNHFQGYPRAKDAPPEVQDTRMREDLLQQLQRFQGDPFKVVANHYYPRHAHDPTQWDKPLTDSYGKPITDSNGKPAQTIKEYLQGVLPAERVSKYLAGIANANGPGS
jgi:hypothetical protein